MTTERPPDKYVVVVKDGIDTLHRNPEERCNVDDAKRRQVIDEAMALRMKMGGFVRLCDYCYPAAEERDDE